MKSTAPIQISIPQPCHEGWEKMMPVQGGRHCAACSKVITDFTGMTDRELVNYFKEFKGGGCGRFEEGQLDRSILPPAEVRHSWWIRVGLAALVLVGLSENSSAQKVKGKSSVHARAQQKKGSPLNTEPSVVARTIVLNGDAIDSLAGVTLTVYRMGAFTGNNNARGYSHTIEQEKMPPVNTPVKLLPISSANSVDFFQPTPWQRLKHRLRHPFR